MALRLLLVCCLALIPVASQAASRAIDGTPRIALLSAYEPEWTALRAAIEAPVSHRENGVDMITGRVEGHDVVLVLTGMSMVNAAMTAQMAIDRFNLTSMVFSGIAGGVDPSLNIGDVVVAERWGEYLDVILARETTPGHFTLPKWAQKDQDYPNFAMVFPRGVSVAREGHDKPVRQFWFPVDDKLLAVARAAAGQATLNKCLPDNTCLSHAPKVVVGGNGVSGTAFVDNANFRTFAFKTFGAQVLDMESAAVAHVASMNAVPYLAFRSLSDLAGGGPGENEEETFEHLASENSVAVLRAFLKALPQ